MCRYCADNLGCYWFIYETVMPCPENNTSYSAPFYPSVLEFYSHLLMYKTLLNRRTISSEIGKWTFNIALLGKTTCNSSGHKLNILTPQKNNKFKIQDKHTIMETAKVMTENFLVSRNGIHFGLLARSPVDHRHFIYLILEIWDSYKISRQNSPFQIQSTCRSLMLKPVEIHTTLKSLVSLSTEPYQRTLWLPVTVFGDPQ